MNTSAIESEIRMIGIIHSKTVAGMPQTST
jgi:hypothetical protein